MNDISTSTPTAQRVEITAGDLPLHCPMARTPVWNYHPRVYLTLSAGEAKCPYCGMLYAYRGTPPAGH